MILRGFDIQGAPFPTDSTVSKNEMETTIVAYYRCILKVAGFREKGHDFQAAVRLVTIR